MKWTYLITLFRIFFSSALVLYLFGCAGNTPNDKIAQRSKKQNQEGKESQNSGSSNPQLESTTKMKISYANRSSNISMEVDVNNQDINLEMTGSSIPSLPMNSKASPPLTSGPNEQPSLTKPKNTPETSGDEDWDDVMSIAKNEDIAKGNGQSVLTEIRKAQEFFYQKRYPEALNMAKFSIQKKETAEGYALKGSIEYMMGNDESAKESWNQSLRLNPDMPSVTQMLRKLKIQEEKKESKN